MRVSLQIDGDSTGAVKAAGDASRAIADIGKQSADASDKVAEGFEKAAGAAGKIKGMSEAAGAANDNVANTIANLAQRVADLATKALGSESALSKATAGTSSFIAGIGNIIKAASPLGLISGSIGLATTAISTFYSIANSGAQTAQQNLDEQARLIGAVRDAYKDGARSAGDFFTQSKSITQLQLSQNIIKLRSDLAAAVQGGVSSFYTDYAIAGISGTNNPFGDGTETKNLEALKGAVDRFNSAMASGSADASKYLTIVSDIGNAAEKTNPALAAAANRFVEQNKNTLSIAAKLQADLSSQNILKGIGTDRDARIAGISSTAKDAAGSFERFAKSVDRQSAALEAEARTVGLSAGAIAQMRGEVVLTEAAHQAGGATAKKYADQIAAIAARAGEATQNLAVAKIQSGATFQLSQLGRNSIDQSVAAQLQGAFGNNADLNGSTAQLVRFTETMKDLKATTLDVSQGAWRTFLSGLQQGQSIFKSLGDAGVDALNRIIAKLGDRAIDNFVSALFGGGSSSGIFGSLFGSSGGGVASTITVGSQSFPAFGAAAGGTFGPGWGVVGEKGPEIIRVFNGGVTVYPHEVSKPYLPGFAEGGTLSALGNVTRLPRGPRQDNAPIQIMRGDTQVIIQGNADEKTVALMKQELQARDRDFYGNVIRVVNEAQSRGVIS